MQFERHRTESGSRETGPGPGTSIATPGAPVAPPPCPSGGPGAAPTSAAPVDPAGGLASALAATLRRALRQSLDAVSAPAQPIDPVVHEARKSNKRVAATAWLLEPWVSPVSFERARRLVRKSSRLLRHARRAAALLATLEQLGAADSATRTRLIARLDAERELDAEVLAKVARLLSEALMEVATWPERPCLDEALLARFRKARRQTHRLARKVRRKPSPEKLHDLRKKVKRQLALGAALAPFIGPAADVEQLDALGDRLGDVNDLEDLRDTLRRFRKGAPKGELRPLRRRVRRTQREEIAAALVLARNVLKGP